MIFKDLERIVFAGDSVTDMGSQQPVGGRTSRIHPNLVGATIIAKAFLEQCNFDYAHKREK